jgi:deoxyxylulose-5-phosphate synthase
VLGIPRAYIPQDKPDRILARFGLDGPGLAQSIREVVSAPVLPTSVPDD